MIDGKIKQTEMTAKSTENLIYHLSHVNKRWGEDISSFNIFIEELKIRQGEKIAFIGDSGCGKSTILDMLAFTSQPSKSEQFDFYVKPKGKQIDVQTEWRKRHLDPLSRLRKRHIGYVMQTGGLLPYLTVEENIFLSRDLLKMPEDDTVFKLVNILKLRRHLNKLPATLSIGERQRVAIARALAHKPKVVIADEPTASLDPFSAKTVMNLFIKLTEDFNITLIIASHDWHHLKKYGLQSYLLHTTYSEYLTETIIKKQKHKP